MKIASKWMALAILLSFLACSESDRIKARPGNIISTTIDPAVLQRISENFPEHKNIKTTFPKLFDAASQKQVILTEESEIYLAYISEGASYSNTFGWYSYTPNESSSASALNLHLLFPNVSNKILKQGDMLQLGSSKFPAGTVIGFFLIIQGWEDGKINYDRETFYTSQELNPDNQQQHVLFKQKDLGSVILTFEDLLTSRSSDEDFNDILFLITDNTSGQAVSKIELGDVVELD